MEMKKLFTNEHGVTLLDPGPGNHCKPDNAECWCGADLIASPPIFDDPHEKGNPVMRCTDHGVHAYWFKNLVPGKQRKEDEELYKQRHEKS